MPQTHIQIRTLAVLACFGVAAVSQADVQFYFASQGSTAKLSRLIAKPSSVLALTVVVKNTGSQPVTFNAANVMLGLGTTATAGTSATPDAGSMKIVLNGTPANSVTFPYSLFHGTFARDLRGGRGASGNTRPYGLNVPVDLEPGTSTTLGAGQSVKLFDVFLKTPKVAGRTHQHLFLYDAGDGAAGTSLLLFGRTRTRTAGDWVTVSDLDVLLGVDRGAGG